MHALLAAPSTGGEVKRNFNASLCIPVISFFDDRGCIMAEKRIPFLQGLIRISRAAVRHPRFKLIQMLNSGGFNVLHQSRFLFS